MERKYESANKSEGAGLVVAATEAFMANLPILVCGLVVGLVIAREMLMS